MYMYIHVHVLLRKLTKIEIFVGYLNADVYL